MRSKSITALTAGLRKDDAVGAFFTADGNWYKIREIMYVYDLSHKGTYYYMKFVLHLDQFRFKLTIVWAYHRQQGGLCEKKKNYTGREGGV